MSIVFTSSEAASGLSSESSTFSAEFSDKTSTIVKNDILNFFHHLRSRKSGRIFTNVLTAIEFFQFLALTFSPQMSAWKELDTYFMNYMSPIRTFGIGIAPETVTTTITWILFILPFFFWILAIPSFISIRRGDEDRFGRTFTLLQILTQLYIPVLYIPSITALISATVCENEAVNYMHPYTDSTNCERSSTLQSSILGVSLGFNMFTGLIISLLYINWQPSSQQRITTTTIQYTLLVYCCRTFPTLLEYTLLLIGNRKVEMAIYSIALLLINVIFLGYIIHNKPFHIYKINMGAVGIISFSTMLGCCRAIATILQHSSSIGGVVALVISIIFTVIMCLIMRKLLNRAYYPTSEYGFTRDVDFEIATRFAYGTQDEGEFEKAIGIFMNGFEAFPQSAYLRIHHAIFIMCANQTEPDFQMMYISLRHASKMQSSFDVKILHHLVEKKRKQMLRSIDGGLEEITLRLKDASYYQDECKKAIQAFWGYLAKDEDLDALSSVVASIELHESKCDRIFQKLLLKFPRASRVLRAYGIYVEEIKNDSDLAQMSFRAADSIEEERSTKHRHPRVSKAFSSASAVTVTSTSTSSSFNLRRNKVSPSDSMSSEVGPAELDKDIEYGSIPGSVRGVNFKPITPGDSYDVKSIEMSEVVEDTPRTTEEVISNKINSEKINQVYRTRRNDILRQRKYRKQIEVTKSGALKRLGIVLRLTFFVVFLNVIIIFGVSKTHYGAFSKAFEVLESANNIRSQTGAILVNTRQLELSLLHPNFSTLSSHDYRTSLESSAALVNDGIQNIVSDQKVEGGVSYAWQDPHFLQTNYFSESESDITRTNTSTNAWDLANTYVDAARTVAKLPDSSFLYENETSGRFQFILDNGPISVTEAFNNVVDAYQGYYTVKSIRLYLTFVIIVPVVWFLVIALLLVLIWPAIIKLRRERNDALKLFLEIPKASVQTIYDNITRQRKDKEQEEENNAGVEDRYEDSYAVATNPTTEMSVTKKLILRFVAFSISLCVLVTFMALAGVTTTAIHQRGLIQLNYAGLRSSLVHRTEMAATEYIFNDNNTWTGGRSQLHSLLNESLIDLHNTDWILRWGSEEIGLKGIQGKAQQNIDYQVPCHLLNNDTCVGLIALLNNFKTYGNEILNTNETKLDLYIKSYQNLRYVRPELLVMLETSSNTVIQDMNQKIRVGDIVLNILFAVTFPVVFLAYIFLKPVEDKIRQENQRTLKLFLLLPFSVIDNTPIIKEYLETGAQENAQKKLKNNLEENIARNKSILEAAVDAVIVIDAVGSVEVFNPAAEQLFGYSASEVIGQNVKMLMPPRIASKHDSFLLNRLNSKTKTNINRTKPGLQAQKKDGTLFSISLSLSESIVNGKTLYAGFIRDISQTVKREQELTIQRERSEKLLMSLLPSSIAQVLKDDMFSENSTGTSRPLIAEAYKDVTILFADIVGFTTMSANISPSQLVHLLNSLFSTWDALCEKYNLEKIKTIGDCFMLAGGVPIRSVDHVESVMEFAIDMLDSLVTFNKSSGNNLKIRIGINTGSVVGGVIGTKKIQFDLWGDAVNVASRMESSGVENRIQVSAATYERLKDDFVFEERGMMEVKGKGKMLTYLYVSRRFERTASGHTRRNLALTPDVPLLRQATTNESGHPPGLAKRRSGGLKSLQHPSKSFGDITDLDLNNL